ncbi:FliH/SctL family protein [Sphingomonas sp. PR090111-T3T-6A]|uniref:FliH/SctL family protein n=1 Tax=Sphingomonas sp. PR090111-T3T-6A TaxID=685778 RepID=UPI0003755212|nr:FliH/SctL family protein [Sphingomonas sp. PR090111-T3T-6A]
MSNLFAAERAASATAVPVWTQPRRTAPFTSWHEALQDQGEPDCDVEPEVEPEEEERVDIDAVRAASIAQGYAAGLEAGRREADKERDALERLALGLQMLRPEPTQGLGAMIATTVERLVRQVMGEVDVDVGTLMDRAQAAAALIGEETRPTVLKLNPADISRLNSAELPVSIEADPTLAPGDLRLETGAGAIEDGASVRLERLRAALDRVAGSR